MAGEKECLEPNNLVFPAVLNIRESSSGLLPVLTQGFNMSQKKLEKIEY